MTYKDMTPEQLEKAKALTKEDKKSRREAWDLLGKAGKLPSHYYYKYKPFDKYEWLEDDDHYGYPIQWMKG